jgi:hypothetical protein
MGEPIRQACSTHGPWAKVALIVPHCGPRATFVVILIAILILKRCSNPVYHYIIIKINLKSDYLDSFEPFKPNGNCRQYIHPRN